MNCIRECWNFFFPSTSVKEKLKEGDVFFDMSEQIRLANPPREVDLKDDKNGKKNVSLKKDLTSLSFQNYKKDN